MDLAPALEISGAVPAATISVRKAGPTMAWTSPTNISPWFGGRHRTPDPGFLPKVRHRNILKFTNIMAYHGQQFLWKLPHPILGEAPDHRLCLLRADVHAEGPHGSALQLAVAQKFHRVEQALLHPERPSGPGRGWEAEWNHDFFVVGLEMSWTSRFFFFWGGDL